VAEGCAVLGAGARRAVLDKGAVIPPGARIEYDAEADRRRYYVSDSGITVVPRPPLHPPETTRGAAEGPRAELGPPRPVEVAA
jgi:glucose-1-phosphate adenylyltransferase